MHLDSKKDQTMGSFALAIQDFCKAALQYRVWLHLGWAEVKQRYRRSVIGPWWISLSMLIFIVMMGIVFSRLFHQSLNDYIPFFTAGFLFWSFISASVIESAEVFKSNGGFIKQVKLPFHLYVFKHLVRQVIILGHNVVVYLLVCAFFKFNPGTISLLVIPGFVLFLLNVYWICFMIALILRTFSRHDPHHYKLCADRLLRYTHFLDAQTLRSESSPSKVQSPRLLTGYRPLSLARNSSFSNKLHRDRHHGAARHRPLLCHLFRS